MENEFGSEINSNIMRSVQDAQSMAVSDIIGGGIVATVADFGASVWNSLPGTSEVDTADILQRVSGSGLKVYQENPDAIHAASFIGGIFVPMGLAAKGMTAARAGAKGVGWFSNANRVEDLAEVGRIFGEAGKSTAAYREAVRNIYTKTAVNQGIDAIAGELAIVATMNAHPFMEDYMKDVGSNFALGALLGAGLGAGVGAIADRFALKQVTGSVMETAINDTVGKLRAITPDMSSAVKLQSFDLNINNLEEILTARKALGKDATNDLTFNIAESVQLSLKARQVETFKDMVSPEVAALQKTAPEEFNAIMQGIVKNPNMFGVDEFRLLTEAEVASNKLMKAPKTSLTSDGVSMNTVSDAGPIKPTAEAVYFPDLGLFGVKADAKHYANASVYGKTMEQLGKSLHKNWGKIPNHGADLDLMAKGSAELQAELLGAMEKVNNLSVKEFAKLHGAETDIAFQTAVLHRMLTDPDVAGITVKFSNEAPVLKEILKEHTETLVRQGKMTAQQAAIQGPDAAYEVGLKNLGKRIDTDTFNPVKGAYGKSDAQVTADIAGWISGSGIQDLIRKAVEWQAMAHGGFKLGGMTPSKIKMAQEFRNIYESEGSKALRAEFHKIADADGYVYLYRGWAENNIQGHAVLASYTTDIGKAGAFVKGNTQRGVKLYRVDVNDIVAGFKDIGDAGKNNAEVIVMAGARVPVAEMSPLGHKAMVAKKTAQLDALSDLDFTKGADEITTTTKTTVTKEVVESGSYQMGPEELSGLFIANKQMSIDALLDQGIPFPSIALKTNTPMQIVETYAAIRGANPAGLSALVPPNVSPLSALSAVKSLEEGAEALKANHQPLLLKGNERKNATYVANHNVLDNQDMLTINREFTSMTMDVSKSEAAREMNNFLQEMKPALDMVAMKIGLVNNELGGSGFINSFDMFSRNMKEVGPIFSYIGRQVEKLRNNTIAKVVKPLEIAMESVVKDAGAVVEMTTFYNVNAGLKGWRGLDAENYLVQKVMEIDARTGKEVEVLKRVKYQEREYQLKTVPVVNLVKEMEHISPELKSLVDTGNRIKGTKDVSDIGLWIPSFNPVDKFISYVHNTVDDSTKILWANTANELEELTKAYRKKLIVDGLDDKIKVVSNKEEQANWNLLNGRLDSIHMEVANLELQKTGSSGAAIIKPDIGLFGDIVRGYEHYITSQVRNLADLNMSEITGSLKRISDYETAYTSNQPLSEVKKFVNKPKDTAAIMRNTLLGGNSLGEYAGWSSINKSFETVLTISANRLTDAWNAVAKPLMGKDKSIDIASVKKIDFDAFTKDLEKRGIAYPWKDLDRAAAMELGYFNLDKNPNTSKRIINASNALAATMALRFGELAQPLVNAVSMPILTSLAMAHKMPESFMGVQKGTAKIMPAQVMYEGIRGMNSPFMKDLNKKWEEMGYFSPMVSEASDIIRATRRFEKGAVAAIENALDSNIVKIMSKPSDLTESFTRKAAMNMGAQLAKRLYPELDDVGVTIFARDFMDKAIGNFHASQRPVFFQGTLGMALGIFQTYTLTMGQSIYRHLELRNYKALMKASLTQSSIFGASSMPGFDQISQLIGDKFSDDNVDLITGTYRATGDQLGDFLLYGMPSTVGPTISTRGDINPRFPNPIDGLKQTVAYNFASQAYAAIGRVGASLGSEAPDVARAFGQALSLQSLSRPLARGAELVTGSSITSHGNTVQTPEEVWSMQGVMARVLATRPLREQKLRDADHLNRFYGAADRDRREVVMKDLKTAIRGGTLTEERIAVMAEKYFRHGGSPTGWRSAVNTSIATVDAPGSETFIDKLKPDNPLNYMIEGLDGR